MLLVKQAIWYAISQSWKVEICERLFQKNNVLGKAAPGVCSWGMNNLGQYSKFSMLQLHHLNELECILFQEHIVYMLLGNCEFKCSWSIFDLQHYSGLFMLDRRHVPDAKFKVKISQKLEDKQGQCGRKCHTRCIHYFHILNHTTDLLQSQIHCTEAHCIATSLFHLYNVN